MGQIRCPFTDVRIEQQVFQIFIFWLSPQCTAEISFDIQMLSILACGADYNDYPTKRLETINGNHSHDSIFNKMDPDFCSKIAARINLLEESR